jgi:hypothetical protein
VRSVVVSARFSTRLNSHLGELQQGSLLGRSDIIRLLVARARLDDLPKAWRDLSPEERELLRGSR